MGQLVYEEETFAIRGAVFEVYRVTGSKNPQPITL